MLERPLTARSLPALLLVLSTLAFVPVADASWPGRNGSLVFVRVVPNEEGIGAVADGIWRRAPGLDAPRLRLTGDDSDREPTVSRNGRWVAFSREVGAPVGESSPGRAIFAMRIDGSGVFQVTDGRSEDTAPAFSRSGRRILFARAKAGGGPAGVYSIRADGSGLRRLTAGYSPAFSPRGNLVAFGRGGLFTMRPDGSRVRRLAPDLKRAVNDPDFSPSGGRIAFSAAEEGEGHLYTIRIDGRRVRQLTDSDRCDRCHSYTDPAYSPDGRALAATAANVYHSRLEVLRLTKPALKNLGAFGDLMEPVWQPLPRRR